jgi:hypothetical protein
MFCNINISRHLRASGNTGMIWIYSDCRKECTPLESLVTLKYTIFYLGVKTRIVASDVIFKTV